MARSRNIKPGFFKSEQVADCSDGARLLFIGLWTLADFQGVLEWRPRKVKAELFPYDENRDMETLISELETNKLISILDQQERRFIHCREFTVHQNPSIKEVSAGTSRPDPSQFNPSTIPVPSQDDPDTMPVLPHTDSLIPYTDSPVPDPDSLIKRSLVSAKPRKRKKQRKRNEYTLEFEAWWAIGPKAGNKLEAFEEWQILDPSPDLQEVLHDSIKEQVLWRQVWLKVDRGHCGEWKHMCRWIKLESWDNELDWPKNYGTGAKPNLEGSVFHDG